MGRSQRLTLIDVRNVTRLAWEAAELSHDRFTQMQHLATGLRDLIGGQVGFTARMDAYVVGEEPVPEALVPCLDPEPNVNRYLQIAGRSLPILADPFMDKGRDFKPVAGCINWPWVCAQVKDWRPYSDTMDIMQQAKSRDVAISVFRHDDGRHVTAVSIHRAGESARPYGTREYRLCTLLAEELYHLYRTGRLEPPASPLDCLSPSLRRVADRLLAGQPAKQIAFELGLSIYTVREYMRGIYEHLGADDLADFLRRFAAGKPR